MLDLIIRNCQLPGVEKTGTGRFVDIAVNEGKIVLIDARVNEKSSHEIDAGGNLVTPPFVDSHFHMDSTLTFGLPRMNQSGTLLEGIKLVAFPQDGFLRHKGAKENLSAALDMGVDVVGGIPHYERTMQDGAESIARLCRIAADRGLKVDMHCDETDDPMSRHIESLAYETHRLGLQGRVTGSHLTSMHSMDNYYVSKLIPLISEAKLHVVANPLINITLQGRHDSYPKRRGMTRVKELMAARINVAFGHDCVMDPWYPLGTHDMLEVAAMGLHVGQMTGIEEMKNCFAAVTTNGAAVLGLSEYGLEKGNPADLVILQCKDEIEALRLRPARLYVLKAGKMIARTTPVNPEVFPLSRLKAENSPPLSREDFCL